MYAHKNLKKEKFSSSLSKSFKKKGIDNAWPRLTRLNKQIFKTFTFKGNVLSLDFGRNWIIFKSPATGSATFPKRWQVEYRASIHFRSWFLKKVIDINVLYWKAKSDDHNVILVQEDVIVKNVKSVIFKCEKIVFLIFWLNLDSLINLEIIKRIQFSVIKT